MNPTDTPTSLHSESVDEILSGLTIEQKVGLLFQPIAMIGDDVDLDAPSPLGGGSLRHQIVDKGIRYFCLASMPEPANSATVLNTLQDLATSTGSRLPIIFSTDPRHAFIQNAGASHRASGVSQWPEPIGFGALRDPDAVRAFADVVRQDYLAMGVRMALHPQVDLATEPRWARQAQSFSADPHLTATLLRAYLEGLQGSTLGPTSIAATAKHFPGGGPQLDGEDPHFPYGREQVYPGGRLRDHLIPFEVAIEAGVAAIMPYYGMPVGLTLNGEPVEEVGFAFNRQILMTLLREELGFDGIILSDFGLITDATVFGKPFPARAWGVEHLTGQQRVSKLLHAGVDQFGGESNTELVVNLLEAGDLSEERLDASVRRHVTLMRDLGITASDADKRPLEIGTAEQITLGESTQAASLTVLTNQDAGGKPLLPLSVPQKAYLVNVDPSALPEGWTASPIEEAAVAVVRSHAPYEERDTYFLENGMEQGSLDFSEDFIHEMRSIARQVPLVLVVTLSRPAILTPLAEFASAIVADYGASDTAVLDVLTGRVRPRGKLPFELPRSMEAVAASRPDVPSDTTDPLFPIGWGLNLVGAEA
ncbi:glycoside hydrolase family 3 protein [Arthrobacter burdickii]|uniref:beta-glucosidase n=1 Tax=Arthrobacter burdickii TaxID=3035920 RepID=A0ABT8JY93_9MICC|nr:glycoside hydrolase family 3 N-terminal domain-containing protein [Arthrobacter burdickii]MDN4610145.1 glycoside hydrolase family 3 N-terminal domain-containing protein [Arthrobacter burdickii]